MDLKLFNDDEQKIETIWEKEWQDMPSFSMIPEKPLHTIKLHFKTIQDMEYFSKLIDQEIKKNKENYWFPKLNRCAVSPLKYYNNES